MTRWPRSGHKSLDSFSKSEKSVFLSQLKHLLEFHLCYLCSEDLARVLKGDEWSVKLTLITLGFFKLNELYFAQIICVSKTLVVTVFEDKQTMG